MIKKHDAGKVCSAGIMGLLTRGDGEHAEKTSPQEKEVGRKMRSTRESTLPDKTLRADVESMILSTLVVGDAQSKSIFCAQAEEQREIPGQEHLRSQMAGLADW